MLNHEDNLGLIFQVLPDLKDFHHRDGATYKVLDNITSEAASSIFGKDGTQELDLMGLGKIRLPFVSMGEIKSTHLFGLDELIIFSFYLKNKTRYKKVFDIGANIGLHSIILAMIGYEVVCYEPDPWHFKMLQDNLNLNSVATKVFARNKAISTVVGELEFIRVLGNTTGSHLAGAKKNPYGDLEKFKVFTDRFRDIMAEADLLKIDVEGHEADLLLSTSKVDWVGTDAIIEIGTLENARAIFDHMQSIGVNIFSQKKSWQMIVNVEDLPSSYKEGSIFVTLNTVMPW